MPDPKVTCWMSGNVRHEVETARASGESEEDWCARHDQLVAEAQLKFPPNAQCPGP